MSGITYVTSHQIKLRIAYISGLECDFIQMGRLFLSLAIRVLQRGGLRMLENFLAAAGPLAVAKRWDDLSRLFDLTDRLLSRDQTKLNAAYDTSVKTAAKISAAIS